MDRTLKCDHSLESRRIVFCCGAVCFSLLPSFEFWNIINFGLGTVRSGRIEEAPRNVEPCAQIIKGVKLIYR